MKMLKAFIASTLIGFMSSFAFGFDSNSHTIIPGTDTHNSGDLEVSDLQLTGGDVVDSNGTTRVSIGTTNTITGNLTVTGNVNFSMQLSSAPKTSSTLIFKSTGTLVYNTQDSQVCVATSTNQNSFVNLFSTSSATCGH